MRVVLRQLVSRSGPAAKVSVMTPGGASPRLWPQLTGSAGLVALLVLMSLIAGGQGLFLSIIISYCIWATAGQAWNIISGFGGQLSFGHAAFFGVGAYTMAILLVKHDVSPWYGMLAGGVIAAVLGLLVGIPTFRLRGPYFALGTWAVAQAIYDIAVYSVGFTGGNDGIELPGTFGFSQMQWSTLHPFALITIGMLAVTLVVVIFIRRSRLGYLLLAVRDDHTAAAALGVWPLRTKLTGLVISAFLTGMAGALLGRYLSVVDPFDFLSVQVSSTILLVTFIGGLATVAGPLVGAALIIPAEQWLQLEFGSVSSNLVFQIGLGCFLILMAILLPQGVWGGAVDLGSSLRRGQRRLRGDGAGMSGEPEVSEEAVT